MKFIFLSIKPDAYNYTEQKLKTLMAYSQPEQMPMSAISPATLQNAVSQVKNQPPRIASAEEFFKATAAQLRQVEISQRCALMELAMQAPLIEGETIKEDFFSYLLEPFRDVPAYTAVLKRTTNMAEMLYFFEMVRIDNGKVVHLAPPEPEVPQVQHRLRGGIMLSGELIKKLLKKTGTSVATGAASKLGAFIVGLVIKEIYGDDTQKMLDEIKSIVKNEVEGNELAKVEGAVYGALQFLDTEYRNLKASADLNDARTREKLQAKLDSYSKDFYTVLGFLRSEKYARRGLKTFMIAAPVHLILTQEMALVDPDTRAIKDANDSTYTKTLRDNAAVYRKHVETVFAKAIKERNNMEVFTDTFVDCMGSSCVHKTRTRWRDNFSGAESGEFFESKDPRKTAWEYASASLEKHRTAVLAQLTEDLGKPQETFLSEIGALEKFAFPSPAKAGLKLGKKAVARKA